MLIRLYLNSGKILNLYGTKETLDIIQKYIGTDHTITNHNNSKVQSIVNLKHVEFVEVEYTNEQ